ncbi:putative uncharacterized protein [Waddlia chondrophila 2032/99]|uniref:Uncharacterized protein n=1 Tax=Waddlia chondrophila 2032/99 TaxID=765953 RepID=F8LFL2_9BACT|nr:putative uncharacterized protein [Waddlia chondrophila 2032/99]
MIIPYLSTIQIMRFIVDFKKNNHVIIGEEEMEMALDSGFSASSGGGAASVREIFLKYVHNPALAQAQGSGDSAFDVVTPAVQELGPAWRDWLTK